MVSASDFMYLAWKQFLAQKEPSTAAFNYYVVYDIVNRDSRNVLYLCMNRQKNFPPWPGQTFAMDDKCGKAILGTPNGTIVGYMLAQHIQEPAGISGSPLTKGRTIDKIVIFGDSDKPTTYNMVVYIKSF